MEFYISFWFLSSGLGLEMDVPLLLCYHSSVHLHNHNFNTVSSNVVKVKWQSVMVDSSHDNWSAICLQKECIRSHMALRRNPNSALTYMTFVGLFLTTFALIYSNVGLSLMVTYHGKGRHFCLSYHSTSNHFTNLVHVLIRSWIIHVLG